MRNRYYVSKIVSDRMFSPDVNELLQESAEKLSKITGKPFFSVYVFPNDTCNDEIFGIQFRVDLRDEVPYYDDCELVIKTKGINRSEY